MDIVLSRKLAKFMASPKGLALSLDERLKIVETASTAKTETDLPKYIFDYINEKKENL